MKPKKPSFLKEQTSLDLTPVIKSGEFVSFYKPVVISTSKNDFTYHFKINEEMPRFSFQPLGKEIYHRLCLRIVLAKSLSEFITPSEKAGDEKRLRDE